ncbi:MAG: leucine-rich repeat domain-containing protein [Sedimentisphaerales bacterium]|nr:leucine-rich repeat domain-containing protein [Sedimentisphaerales bacterium]
MMRVFVWLLFMGCLLAPARAEDPVTFPDPVLQEAVERTLQLYAPTPTDMLGLVELDNSQSFTTQENGISDLAGLEHAVNLQTLNLRLNLVSDAGPLSELHNLQHVNLSQNRISDLSPLAGLTRLRYLNLHANRFSEISSLSALENLEYLSLHTNRVEDLSPLTGLSALQTLVLRYNRVGDLSPLSGLTRLAELDLYANPVRDLSPLAGLLQLRHLDAGLNLIDDISPLAGVNSLETLYLSRTNIREISPLLGLTNLSRLNLEDNGLLYNEVYCWQLPALLENTPSLLLEYTPNHRAPTGLSASDGTHSDKVRLTWNHVCNGPHYTSYYRVYRALTTTESKTPLGDWQTSPSLDDETAEPGVTYTYWVRTAVSSEGLGAGSYSDPESGWASTEPTSSREYNVSISSTPGGQVAEPGEGTFVYEEGESVKLRARANHTFVFVKWSGVAGADQNPAWLTVTENQDIQASFASALAAIHVDDDAPADPAPGTSDQSDPAEDGTPEHPFDSIQEAIDVAAGGASIFVRPGTYGENIDFLGKRVALFGIDANDPGASAYPVIHGTGTGPVVTFAGGEDPNCVLMGFVLTGGRGGSAGAIRCAGASPTIMNCLIVGNRAADRNGAAVHCTDSNAVFVNCTIADNTGGPEGGGLFLENGNVIVANSILWGNTPGAVLVTGMGEPTITYSDVAGGWPGPGNLDADPLFVRPGWWNPNGTPYDSTDDSWIKGDYHLQSQGGRWDMQSQAWDEDDLTSPCIDAGDPTSPVHDEPAPHGNLVNAGAYGGTAGASLTPPAPGAKPVHFPDPILKEAVETALWVRNPTPTDMLALMRFACPERGVNDIRGLEYAFNLQDLSLRWNEIRDLSPLSGLTSLEKLDLSRNHASDPSPLSGLTNLRHLNYHENGITDISSLSGLGRLQTLILHENEISDVSALAGMTDLRELDLLSNRISDVSPLLGLTRLERLDLRVNPLSEASCEIYVPQIIANNPDMAFDRDVCVWRSVSITSSAGGSVTNPGEGVFTYQNGKLVRLVAQADPGYTFLKWSGTYSTAQNPTILVVTGDHEIRAEFAAQGT